jgi:hypothetical protein
MHDDVYDEAEKERKRAYNKAYKEKHKERLKAERKAYYENNKECVNAKKKAYYEANADHMKEYQKRYHKKYNVDAANIERKKEYNKQLDAANIERKKALSRKSGRKRYDVNPEKCKADARACKLRNYGCIECKDWPDCRVGLPHYDSHCYRCFSRKFPDHPKVRTKERAEDTVKAYINANFAGFIHNHQMPTAHCVCDHRRRIDHRREVGNTLLCIETDEHHHRNYDKDDEDARYHDMLMGWGGKLVFIRFNPDGKGPPLEDRLERLHAEILRHIGRLERGENSALLEVWHLYYPEGTEDYCGEAIAPEGL